MVVEENDSPRSPEAKLGMQVEDLWDIQEPQLSPTEKLNACFESIPVSAFPQAPSSQVVEISSDTSIAEAVKLLARHRILSAPVVNVNAPEDASWIDRYIGIVEFAGIVVWILHQSEKMEGYSAFDSIINSPEKDVGPAVAAAASGMCSPRFRSKHPDSPTATCGEFFENLTSSDFYKNTKVGDISGSFRWAPFLALQKANSFLTMLLLLSKYRMKSIPVVDLGDSKIDNIITQSAVIHMLEECAGLHWFESWGSKKLHKLGLPLMKPSHIIKVYEDEPVLQAFKLMRQHGVGGMPVVASAGTTLLHKYQLPREQLDSWMCIAWRESRYNSLHINTINTDGSRDYGLFQINNRWWCSNKESPQPNQNMCNVPCETVLESLDETVKCIKTMYAKSKNTWEPWITYPYCQKEDMTQFTKGCEGLEPIPALGGSSHEQYQPAGRPHSKTHHVKHKHRHVKHKHRHEPVKKV